MWLIDIPPTNLRKERGEDLRVKSIASEILKMFFNLKNRSKKEKQLKQGRFQIYLKAWKDVEET